jgi:hypothetical protein
VKTSFAKASVIPLAISLFSSVPALAGQQRLNSVYWVDRNSCAMMAQPTSVSRWLCCQLEQ